MDDLIRHPMTPEAEVLTAVEAAEVAEAIEVVEDKEATIVEVAWIEEEVHLDINIQIMLELIVDCR